MLVLVMCVVLDDVSHWTLQLKTTWYLTLIATNCNYLDLKMTCLTFVCFFIISVKQSELYQHFTFERSSRLKDFIGACALWAVSTSMKGLVCWKKTNRYFPLAYVFSVLQTLPGLKFWWANTFTTFIDFLISVYLLTLQYPPDTVYLYRWTVLTSAAAPACSLPVVKTSS